MSLGWLNPGTGSQRCGGSAVTEGQLCGGWVPLTLPSPLWCSRASCIQGMGLWCNLTTEARREVCWLLLRKFSSLFKRRRREDVHLSSPPFGFCYIWSVVPGAAVLLLVSGRGAGLKPEPAAGAPPGAGSRREGRRGPDGPRWPQEVLTRKTAAGWEVLGQWWLSGTFSLCGWKSIVREFNVNWVF